MESRKLNIQQTDKKTIMENHKSKYFINKEFTRIIL